VVGRKEKAVAIAIIGILAIVAIDAIYVFPWEILDSPEHSWVWAISDGDVFIFNASLKSEGYYDSYPTELSAVVNESIKATVLYLVNFTGTTENHFIELVESSKVSCTFVNGSTLPIETKLTLDILISRQIFPIGGWEFMNRLYPDSFDDISQEVLNENLYIYWTYLSRTSDEYFFFGYTSLFVDHYTRWGGTTSIATGIPNLIFTSWFSSMSSYNFSLNLVAIQRNQP